MNSGAFGENFPYSNFHDLNMDWIIKIAKDFLDQYTHIQEVIQTGLDDLAESRETGLSELDQKRLDSLAELNQKTLDGLADLQAKYDTLDGLLQAWYDTHSADIANQLADAIADFNASAEAKSQALLDSWPDDYSELVTEYNTLKTEMEYSNNDDAMTIPFINGYKYLLPEFVPGLYINNTTGEESTNDKWISSEMISTKNIFAIMVNRPILRGYAIYYNEDDSFASATKFGNKDNLAKGETYKFDATYPKVRVSFRPYQDANATNYDIYDFVFFNNVYNPFNELYGNIVSSGLDKRLSYHFPVFSRWMINTSTYEVEPDNRYFHTEDYLSTEDYQYVITIRNIMYFRILYYDEQYTYADITSRDDVQAGDKIKINKTYPYFRISLRPNTQNSDPKINACNIVLANDLVTEDDKVHIEQSDILQKTIGAGMLPLLSDVVPKHIILTGDNAGEYEDSNTYWSSSDYIKTSDYNAFLTPNAVLYVRIIYYDNNNDFVSYKSYDNTSDMQTFEIDRTNPYFKLTYRTGNAQSIDNMYNAIPVVFVERKENTWRDKIYENYLPTKIPTIIQNRSLTGVTGDSFFWITDTHLPNNAGNSPYLIDQLVKATGIDKIIFGGDACRDDDSKLLAEKQMIEFVTSYRNNGLANNLYCIVGNHEYNNAGADPDRESIQLSASEIFPFLIDFQQNKLTLGEEGISYYYDDHNKKIRYYFVSCNYTALITIPTRKWVLNSLQSTPNGYSVILFSHGGFQTPTEISGVYKVIIHGLEAFKNHSTFTYDSITYDYTQNNGDVIAAFAGHSHFDGYDIWRGILCISTTCDAYQRENGGLVRTKGTTTEQAFDVVNLDRTNRKLLLTRIGAGYDREFHIDPVAITSTETLTSDLTGSVTWSSSDTSIALVSNGTVTAVTEGECNIIATDTNGNFEVWHVVVS